MLLEGGRARKVGIGSSRLASGPRRFHIGAARPSSRPHDRSAPLSFWSELRRRHLVKILIGYVAVGLAVVEGASLLLPTMAVPDGTYNVIVAIVLLGLPIALALGWALTISPDGEVERIRSRETVAPEPPEMPEPPVEIPAVPDDRSVAVLPFTNLSPDPDNEFFSDGITEEILMTLSRVRGLLVISRTSVMRYKGSDRGIPDIASELGVAHVLEGSVRRFGDRLRITAQLIHAATDGHLWAESYDRDADDVFAIQSDVAERIVRSLRVTLTPGERAELEAAPTEDVEAYTAYLRGRHFLAHRTGSSLQRAIEEFDAAIARDPDFALAWVGRAEAVALCAEPADSGVREVRRAARRALEIQPGLAQAHAALGLAASTVWEWAEARHHYGKAIELNPGYAAAHHWAAVDALYHGAHDEAVAGLERARELDPMSSIVLAALGFAYRAAGRSADAERLLRRGIELDPNASTLYLSLANVLECEGRLAEALDTVTTAERLGEDTFGEGELEALREGLERGGERGYWKAILAFSEHDSDRTLALFELGRPEEALDVIERIIEARARGALYFLCLPEFRELRDTPRGRALIERVRGPERVQR